jgi:predicted acyltransferase
MISFDQGSDGCSRLNNLTDPCNFAGYVDRLVFTENHILKDTMTDPEGFVSTIGALITTYFGYHFCLVAKHQPSPKTIIISWLAMTTIAGLLVYPMNLLMPLNKKLYSSTFTLFVMAASGASLTLLFWLIDILPKHRPRLSRIMTILTAPLVWLGLNPLIIFVLMTLLKTFMNRYLIFDGVSAWTSFYQSVFASWMTSEPLATTVFACFFVLLWTLVAGLMHRCKFYVRL